MQEMFLCKDVYMSETPVRRKPGPAPGFGSKGERDLITVRAPGGTKERLEVLKRALKYESVSDLVSEMIVNALPAYEAGLPASKRDSANQK